MWPCAISVASATPPAASTAAIAAATSPASEKPLLGWAEGEGEGEGQS